MKNSTHILAALAVLAMSSGCTVQTSDPESTAEEEQDLRFPTLDGSVAINLGKYDWETAKIRLKGKKQEIHYSATTDPNAYLNQVLGSQASLSAERRLIDEFYVVNVAYLATLHCATGDQTIIDGFQLKPFNKQVGFSCKDGSTLNGIDIQVSQAHFDDWIVNP